jgi:WD40 repeat protein
VCALPSIRSMPRQSGRIGGARAGGGGASPATVLEHVDRVEAELAILRMRDAELNRELNVANAAKNKPVVKNVKAKRARVQTKIKAAEHTLCAILTAPVSGGRDPTEWLPDEMLLTVFEMLPWETLCSGACERVCLRWARLMESASIVRRKHQRWAAYDARMMGPRMLEGRTGSVPTLAVGLDGKVYSGWRDKTIMVWSGKSGAHLQTLRGHTDTVRALAVGLDGAVYSGSEDRTVRVWSGASGAHVRMLEGHTGKVFALAVGLNGRVYSGSADRTIRVWAEDDGSHLQTLVGHTSVVSALAVGKDGVVYSGSYDYTIRVWSGEDGTHIRTLVGHTAFVLSLAVGPDGRVYSGSFDMTIRVWSPHDDTHLQTLVGHTSAVDALVVSPDGRVFSGSSSGSSVNVWSGDGGAHLHTLSYIRRSEEIARVQSLAVNYVGQDTTLYVGHYVPALNSGCLAVW